MQRQQERERAPRQKPPRSRRSVWELIVAWLLILWGAAVGVVFLLFLLNTIGNDPRDLLRVPLAGLAYVLPVLHGVLCLTAGLSALLRRRLLGRWLACSAALSVVGYGVARSLLAFLWNGVEISLRHLPAVLLSLIPHLLAALLLFFLGWWLGRQDEGSNLRQQDSEA